MPFIDVDATDAVEPSAVPAGVYQLTCVAASIQDRNSTEKNPTGVGQMIKAAFRVADHEEASLVNHTVCLPHESFEKRVNDFFLLQLKRLQVGLGMDVRRFSR